MFTLKLRFCYDAHFAKEKTEALSFWLSRLVRGAEGIQLRKSSIQIQYGNYYIYYPPVFVQVLS